MNCCNSYGPQSELINPAEIQTMNFLNRTAFFVLDLNVNKNQTIFRTLRLVHNSHSPWFFRSPTDKCGKYLQIIEEITASNNCRKVTIKTTLQTKVASHFISNILQSSKNDIITRYTIVLHITLVKHVTTIRTSCT